MLYEFGLHPIEFPMQTPELTSSSRLILWQDGQVLLNDHDVAWSADARRYQAQTLEYVARLNGRDYFTAQLADAQPDEQLAGLRDIASYSETAFMICGRAKMLLDWRDQHRYCGRCGQPLIRLPGESAMHCEPCKLRYYPRISPCIIVLITRGHQVLLAQGERHRASGMYSTLAGFIEAGESAEQAVMREVKEEVNVEVDNIHYLNSQAWPFPNQLMLGFHAEYAGGDIIPAVGEIAHADWFDIDRLPKLPPAISIATWLIRQYQAKFSV